MIGCTLTRVSILHDQRRRRETNSTTTNKPNPPAKHHFQIDDHSPDAICVALIHIARPAITRQTVVGGCSLASSAPRVLHSQAPVAQRWITRRHLYNFAVFCLAAQYFFMRSETAFRAAADMRGRPRRPGPPRFDIAAG